MADGLRGHAGGLLEDQLGGQPGWDLQSSEHVPRIGRVLIARGRDATDVAFSNTFGPSTLLSFTVWTDEVSPWAS